MANKTSIEWTDYNWNFLRGCSRVSEGCRNCYAEGVAARFSGEGMPYEGLAKFVDHKPRWTGEISFHEDILIEPLTWRRPRKVFVNSMSDLFHEKVTDEMLHKAFAVMALTPQHTYQILTKRPERMRKYFFRDNEETIRRWHNAYPKGGLVETLWTLPLPNVWLGVSVEDQKTADERIPLLLNTPASVRWISAEPLLGPIKFKTAKGWDKSYDDEFWMAEKASVIDDFAYWAIHDNGLNWVVVGGESGSGARPCDVQWIREIVDQCKAAGVPVFVKQLGAKPEDSSHKDIWGPDGGHHYTRPIGDPLLVEAENAPGYSITNQQLSRHISNRKGGDIHEFPEDLQIREFPKDCTASRGVGTAAV
jgi:protein gp37